MTDMGARCKLLSGHGVRKHFFCPAMYKSLGSGSGKGLSVITVMSMKTGVSRVGGVVYKVSTKDKGILLNSCPWCKYSLRWWLR